MAFGEGEGEDFINLNLDDVDDGTEPVPDGTYVAQIISAERKQKEGSQYPYIELFLRPHGKTRNLRLSLSFHPKALWNLKLFAKACGIKWTPQGFSIKDFIGRNVGVTVKVAPAYNNPELRVNEVNPPYHAA